VKHQRYGSQLSLLVVNSPTNNNTELYCVVDMDCGGPAEYDLVLRFQSAHAFM